jgi:hypothetical protein
MSWDESLQMDGWWMMGKEVALLLLPSSSLVWKAFFSIYVILPSYLEAFLLHW